MKAQSILLLAIFAFSAACSRPRPKLIPEISPPLAQEEVCTWTGAPAWDLLFPCANGVGWIDAAGKIVVCDVGTKKITPVFSVPFAVTVPPFLQGDLLVLQNKASDRLLIYDLAAGAMRFELLNMGIGRVLGVGPEGLVYLDGDRPAVRLWESPQVAFRALDADDRFFNCQFLPEHILVLGRERLYIFWKKTRRFESVRLPQPAASPFHCDGASIYYGSSQRCLVKLPKWWTRPEWMLKLGQVLERPPLAFAGTIVASPEDRNLLQVNRRGSILWWQGLGSALSFDLLPMNENLAAVLLNRKIKFVDPRRRQVTPFQGTARLLGPPLAWRGDLYFMTCEEGTCRLLRLGNRYGVDIELEPSAVLWAGSSLRFTVSTQNLIEPRWECVIIDAQGQTVFSRSMEGESKASLVWMPPQAGKFIIRVRAKGLNRGALGETSLQVLDARQVVPRFYLHF
jgi:hypothetical protein